MNKNIAIILIIFVSCVKCFLYAQGIRRDQIISIDSATSGFCLLGHVSQDTLAIKSTYSYRVYFSNDTVFIYDTTISVKYVKELEGK